MHFEIDKKFDLDIEKLNKPVVLIGWPGIALVGKLAVSSIKDSIGAELFLEIEYFDFPPKAAVEDGSLSIPKACVYYKARKNHDLFILTAEFQPQSSKGVFEFAQKFCEELEKLTVGKIEMYISAGALVSENPTEDPEVHVCGTDEKLVKGFLKQKKTTIMKSGVIAGANGILPAWAGNKGFAPGICLLAETLPMPMMNVDPQASKILVTILKDYFKIDMNFDELDKKIDEMEDLFDSFKKQADQFIRGSRQEQGSDADSYFR